MRGRRSIPVLAVAAALCAPAVAQVIDTELPKDIRGLNVSERLGEQAPLDLTFTDAAGQTVPLSDYFNRGKPVILALVYYDCPFVCPLVLTRLQEGLNGLDYTVGEDYTVLTISFDHTNTTASARTAKDAYLSGYNKPVTDTVRAGWEFFTSEPGAVRRLADAVGFSYRYIDETGEYAHPISLIVLTPQGRVSRYIYGFDYPAQSLRLALLEASEGRIAASIGDYFLHFCFRYDPTRGGYVMAAVQVMKIGGVLMVTAVGLLIGWLKIGEYRRVIRARGAAPAGLVAGQQT